MCKTIFAIFLAVQSCLIADKPCPFCTQEVVEKQLIYEGDKAVLLYCLTPATEGNVLVIPKRHIMRFEELTGEEMAEVQKIISALAPVFQKAYGIDDYFLMQKNGVNAGQSVEHVHFHVFPCPVHLSKIVAKAMIYRPPLSDKEMQEYCEKLRPYFVSK